MARDLSRNAMTSINPDLLRALAGISGDGRGGFDTARLQGGATGRRAGGRTAGRVLGIDDTNFVDSVYVSIAAGSSWTQPMSQWVNCSDYLNAYVLVTVSAFSGGTATAYLQSTSALADEDTAWNNADTSASITGNTTLILSVRQVSTQDVLGSLLRLRVAASGSTVTMTLKAELLLKQRVENVDMRWVSSYYVNLTNGTGQSMPADAWIDCSRYRNALVLLRFDTISGSGANLTAYLETAAAVNSSDYLWQVVNSTALSSTYMVLDGKSNRTYPPAGVLRLRYYASGNVEGNITAFLIMKE